MWDGNKICALAGSDLQEGVADFGDDVDPLQDGAV